MIKTTWILIANSSEARLFKAEKNTKNMELINEFSHPESREKITDLVTGAPGRYRKSLATPRSVFDDPANPKKVEAERFAHELAETLNEGRNKNLYKSLVVIAPAHFHGLLNRYYNPHVRNLILLTLHKDYTKLKQHELLGYLDGKIRLQSVA